MSYAWLMKTAKPAHRWLFISISLGILAGVCIIFQSAILADIIDRVYIHQASRTTVLSFLSALLGIILFRTIIIWFRESIAFKTATMIKDTVRKKVLQHLMQLSPIELSQHKTGALTSTLIEQIEALHGFFADYLPQMTIAVVLPLIILIIVFIQNWVAGLVLLITGPLIPVFMAFIGMNTAKLNQENFQTLSRMSAHFLDSLQGLTTLKLFHRADAQLATIDAVSDDFRKTTMRVLRVAFLSTAALELFSTIAIAIIAVYLGLGLLGFVHVGFKGVHISLAHALFILLLAPEFFMPLRQLGTFYHARSEAIGAANEILKIMPDTTHENKVPNNQTEFHTKIISLSFNKTSFHYTHQKDILDNFNLTVHADECIAITGPSGSGKSTLLNLIAKFLIPTSGDIIVNHKNIADIDNDTWRDHIALLHQHPRLFHGTIADNIRFAKPHATDDDIKNAARLAGVLDFAVLLPEGLHTLVGEQNLGLSGGQAQRVAIARIILKDAPLILLDEPTAHLDQNNTAIIVDLLNQWRGNKTVIIATHDEKMIQIANRTVAVP
jgi:ATP-binding cassette subfamily C protein CydD